jgi:phage-related protein
MPLETFAPAYGPSDITRRVNVSVLKPDFGEGFSRPALEGINPIRRSAVLKWDVLTAEDADAIVAFAIEHGQDIPFTYRIPGDPEALQWTFTDWSAEYLQRGYRSVSVTLSQSFDFVGGADAG